MDDGRINQNVITALGSKYINALQIENTRLVYGGIKKLHEQLLKTLVKYKNAHARILHIDAMQEDIRDHVKSILDECFDDDGTQLYQNVNAGFCNFWQEYFGENIRNSTNVIGDMVLYFDLVQKLYAQQVDKDDKPYCYENLCFYLCSIMSCEMSYFVHRTGCDFPQIICRSGYDIKELEEGWSPLGAEFEDVFSEPKPGSRNVKTAITEDIWEIVLCDTSLPKGNYVVVQLDKVRGIHLILQYKPESKIHDLKELTRFLYLREDLHSCLQNDFEYLLNLRFDCGFIHFFDESRRKQAPLIMHIADIHADADMGLALDDIKNKIEKQFQKFKSERPDLLVLSGDIADASLGSASQIQANYRIAERMLLKIVSLLWKRERDKIPFDWKRRIVCVPGNHDFASMNLVKATMKQRSLAAGLPFEGETEVMAKFAYYLNFLQEFLDAPIDELIRDSINEVREYRNMGTKIMMLNSSLGSSAERTNKICLDEPTVRRLAKGERWADCDHIPRPYRVCVLHHPPHKDIDYTLDGYEIPKEWNWEEDKGSINELYKAFYDLVTKGRDGKRERIFLDTYKKYELTVDRLNMEGDKKGVTYFTKDAELEKKHLGQISKLGYRPSEALCRMHDRIEFNAKMGREDQKAYKKAVDAICKDSGDVHVLLTGHIHNRNKDLTEIIYRKGMETEQQTVIGGRFVVYSGLKDKNTGQKKVNAISVQLVKAIREDGAVKAIYIDDGKVTKAKKPVKMTVPSK